MAFSVCGRQIILNKNKILYLTALLVSILAGIALKLGDSSMTPRPLKITLPYNQPQFNLDPSRIGFAYEGLLLDNLYGRLVRFNGKGEIIADLADDFFWNGDHFEFLLSGQRKTSRGEPITAKDAELSLKRILYLKQNSHGQLDQFLCRQKSLKSLREDCSGIQVVGNLLKLFPKPNVDRGVFLSILAGIDFSILPSHVIDLNDPRRILDYSHTTGPYYLALQNDDQLYFKPNPNSPLVEKTSIQDWILYRGKMIESTFDLGSKFDLVTSASFLMEAVTQRAGDRSYFETAPLSLEALVFTKQGQQSLSQGERAFVTEELRQILRGVIDPDNFPSYQMFPPDAFGRLSDSDETSYKNLLGSKKQPRQLVRVGFPKSVFERLSPHIQSLRDKNIDLLVSDSLGIEENTAKIDAMYTVTDSAVQEDVALFSYNFTFFLYGVSRSEGEKWLSSYIASTRLQRAKLVEDFHRRILSEFKVAPLFFSRYRMAGVSDLDLSRLDPNSASTHFWKIHFK
jgi:MarR-like DNA-binding transcriptional regulator SgrR of sgrS sRNA